MEDLRKPLLYLLSLAGALVIAYFAIGFYLTFESRQIESEFSRIEKTGHASNAWASYDLICFSNNTGTEIDDFARAADQAGVNLKDALRQCGDKRSCCDLDSDNPGTVGFVRGRGIRCSAVRFAYVLDRRREACIKPSRLKIIQQTFSEKTFPPGRPWVGEIGNRYWKIEEN